MSETSSHIRLAGREKFSGQGGGVIPGVFGTTDTIMYYLPEPLISHFPQTLIVDILVLGSLLVTWAPDCMLEDTDSALLLYSYPAGRLPWHSFFS